MVAFVDNAPLARKRFPVQPKPHTPDWPGITGLRYYNPELGRWVKRDPIKDDGVINPYSFGCNCPMNGIDYLGTKWVEIDSWEEEKRTETIQYFVTRYYLCQCDGGNCAWNLTDMTLGHVLLFLRVETRQAVVQADIPWWAPIYDAVTIVFGGMPLPYDVRLRYRGTGYFEIHSEEPTWKTSLGTCDCDSEGSSDYKETPTVTRFKFGVWTGGGDRYIPPFHIDPNPFDTNP